MTKGSEGRLDSVCWSFAHAETQPARCIHAVIYDGTPLPCVSTFFLLTIPTTSEAISSFVAAFFYLEEEQGIVAYLSRINLLRVARLQTTTSNHAIFTPRRTSDSSGQSRIDPTHDQRTTIIVACVYAVAIVILWNIPILNYLLYPFQAAHRGFPRVLACRCGAVYRCQDRIDHARTQRGRLQPVCVVAYPG